MRPANMGSLPEEKRASLHVEGFYHRTRRDCLGKWERPDLAGMMAPGSLLENAMAVRYEHSEIVAVTPERAFAAIDDLPLTAKWLPPCVSLEKLGHGPNAIGDKLLYVHKVGRRHMQMFGEILDRVPGERLYCKYTDNVIEVYVDLRVAPDDGGTMTTHIIEIVPKRLMAKLMRPLIRLGLGKQTRTAAANLKRLLEGENG